MIYQISEVWIKSRLVFTPFLKGSLRLPMKFSLFGINKDISFFEIVNYASD